MRTILERFRRDPGLAFLAFALVAVGGLYAPTLGRGLLNYDDPWLVRNNFILQHASWASLKAILFDTSPETRFVLGAEYLPVRDVSIMLDHLVWGDWYQGYHLTNLALYLVAIVTWFVTLDELGIDRKLAGLAILLWALHPSHAESVAWISERKGLLGIVCAGVAAFGYARFRAGRSAGYLALAMAAAVAAVWSKAPAAFAIAALAGFELVLPERRRSWRRAVTALVAIAIVGAAAFVPVVIVATNMQVVATDAVAPAGWLAMVVGLHGFYLELAAMAFRNAVSYRIMSAGPSAIDLAIGGLGLVAAVAVAIVPSFGRWRPAPVLRAGAIAWLFGWLPASRLVLPLKSMLVSDRYILFGTLGVALAIAEGLRHIASGRAKTALVAAIALAAGLRTLDAQSNWRDARTLWQRAVRSNPADGDAWSNYAEALVDTGQPEVAVDVVAEGLRHSHAPRLVFREALIVLDHGKRPQAEELMQRAADAGEARAMSNLALLLHEDGKDESALSWGRRAVAQAPMYANGHRILGKIALETNHPDEAFAEFTRTYALWPQDVANRYNLALALIALHRPAEARPHLEACIADPGLGAQCRDSLEHLP